jgi:hypothetical protein
MTPTVKMDGSAYSSGGQNRPRMAKSTKMMMMMRLQKNKHILMLLVFTNQLYDSLNAAHSLICTCVKYICTLGSYLYTLF